MSNNNYQAVYKNTGTTPRTMGEAYRNAEYATPIYRMKTEWEDARDFFVGVVMVFAFMSFFLVLGYGFMAWLELYK